VSDGIVALLAFAVPLGLDSLRVSLGLGTARIVAARELRIALSFAVCDGLALVLGLALGRSVGLLVGTWAGRLGPPVLAAYAFFVLWLGRGRAPGEETRMGGWLVVGLPLSLSFDNLAVGASLGGLRLSMLGVAAMVGCVSGLMALAGLVLGRTAIRALAVRPELAGAALLLVASALSLRADLP
jgi:putative Mn2+ efflux pump MntP